MRIPAAAGGMARMPHSGGKILGILILVAVFVAPIAIATWLVLRARRVPDPAERPIFEPART